MARIYAGILGPLAFLTTLTRGFLLGEEAQSIVFVAWCALWCFAAAGYVIGWISEQTIEQSVHDRITKELVGKQQPESPAASHHSS
ncbi:MAG: hypothetical protein U1E05_20685 [Patescibacteria group bacterium]|nr:hypothetical protein [Patescibacteria group bacterium]